MYTEIKTYRWNFGSLLYPSVNQHIYEVESHTQNLVQNLFSRGMRLSDYSVPANGDCLLIAAMRAHSGNSANDGAQLRRNLIHILNPNNPDSQIYRDLFVQFYGTDNEYRQQYHNFQHRIHGYFNSRLFDFLPLIVSDILNRPILIFDSFINASPSVIVGPNAQNSNNMIIEPIIIARNAATVHYENVVHINPNNVKQKPKNKNAKKSSNKNAFNKINKHNIANAIIDIKTTTSSVNHKIGRRSTGVSFCAVNDIKCTHRYENNKYLLILLLLLCNHLKQKNNKHIQIWKQYPKSLCKF
eukprot:231616_1